MSWDKEKSVELYGINNWGCGYFGINDQGNVEVKAKDHLAGLDLHKLTEELCERGIRPPILLRFPDLLEKRIQLIADCFAKAIKEFEYTGYYAGAYPIKVNQQRHLLEEIVDFGNDCRLGLECGSKPELLIALGLMKNHQSHIICNGFKDEEYIETALLSQKIGRNIFIVVDRFAELDHIIKVSQRLDVKPKIGLRAKLNTQGAGRWNESSGARSKFGLTPVELVQAINRLKDENMIDSLELLHFHIGSQVPSIQNIKSAIKEGARFYTEFYALGARPSYIDVGGGLGVDYDGSGKGDSSTNYSEQEYANDVISILGDLCDEKNVPHPNIISESGRALVAHSSMLVFDVLGNNEVRKDELPFKVDKKDSMLVKDLMYILERVNTDNINEYYNDLIEKKNETLQLFTFGAISLEQRAKAEALYWACATKMIRVAEQAKDAEEIHYNLERHLTDTYYCNFSIFQSLPDCWAVDQVFPVMPIHRLTEEPKRRVTLVDLTCDSDGKIDKFIDTETDGHMDYLDVHKLKPNEPYYMGVFLTGAYQEILGDLHNLFGDTDTAHVTVNEDGTYVIDHVIEGDSVTEVLSYFDYNRSELVESLRQQTELGIKSGSISPKEARRLMRNYEDGLSGYTYLEDPDA